MADVPLLTEGDLERLGLPLGPRRRVAAAANPTLGAGAPAQDAGIAAPASGASIESAFGGAGAGGFPSGGMARNASDGGLGGASWMGGGGGAFGSGIFGGYAGDDIGTGDIATSRHRRGNSVDDRELEDELMALTGGLNLDDDEDEETGIEGGGPSPDGVGIEETGIEGGGRSPDGVGIEDEPAESTAPPRDPPALPVPGSPRLGTRRFAPSQTSLATVPGRSGRVRGGRGGCVGPRPRAETGNGSVARGGRGETARAGDAERDDARGGGEGTRRRREGAPVPLRILLPHHAGCHLRPGDRVGRTHVRTRVHREVARGTRHVAHDRGDAPGQDPAAQSQHAKPNHRLRRNTPERGAVRLIRERRGVVWKRREGKGRAGRGTRRARRRRAGRRDEESSGREDARRDEHDRTTRTFALWRSPARCDTDESSRMTERAGEGRGESRDGRRARAFVRNAPRRVKMRRRLERLARADVDHVSECSRARHHPGGGALRDARPPVRRIAERIARFLMLCARTVRATAPARAAPPPRAAFPRSRDGSPTARDGVRRRPRLRAPHDPPRRPRCRARLLRRRAGRPAP